MQRKSLTNFFIPIMASALINGCKQKNSSESAQYNVRKDSAISRRDTSGLKSWEEQSYLVKQKIRGKWYLEDDSSQEYEIIKDSLYERTQLGTNGYKYTLANFGVINADTIQCSENEYFFSYYRNDTLQFAYVIINITDTTLSLMSPSNAQVAIYKRVNNQ
jgi:hypothetical protein